MRFEAILATKGVVAYILKRPKNNIMMVELLALLWKILNITFGEVVDLYILDEKRSLTQIYIVAAFRAHEIYRGSKDTKILNFKGEKMQWLTFMLCSASQDQEENRKLCERLKKYKRSFIIDIVEILSGLAFEYYYHSIQGTVNNTGTPFYFIQKEFSSFQHQAHEKTLPK